MTTVTVPVPASQVTAPQQAVPVPASVVEAPAQMVNVPASTVQYAIQVPDALATLQAAGYTCTPPTTGTGGTTSPKGTVVKAPSTATINALGATWGINAAAQVTVGGTADTTTASVAQIGWDGALLWQQNAAGGQWSKSAPTAAWVAGTTTIFGGTVVTPPPPPPPAGGITYSTPGAGLVGSGTGAWNGTIIDQNGNLDPYFGGSPAPASQLPGAPGGNWNNGVSIAFGQADTVGTTSVWTPTGEWPQALLHPCGIAGNPMPNGIAVDLAGFAYMILDVCPAAAGLELSSQFFVCEGKGTYKGPNTTVVDTGYPQGATVIANGQLPAGVYTRIKVALSAMNWPLSGGTALQETSSTCTYKVSYQQNSPQAGMKLKVKNVGFTKS